MRGRLISPGCKAAVAGGKRRRRGEKKKKSLTPPLTPRPDKTCRKQKTRKTRRALLVAEKGVPLAQHRSTGRAGGRAGGWSAPRRGSAAGRGRAGPGRAGPGREEAAFPPRTWPSHPVRSSPSAAEVPAPARWKRRRKKY